jgi:hypothetical protein
MVPEAPILPTDPPRTLDDKDILRLSVEQRVNVAIEIELPITNRSKATLLPHEE